MKEVTKSRKEEAIISIITDYIIWRRVESGVHKLLLAFNPSTENCDYEVDAEYSGKDTAFMIMGIFDDVELCSKLSSIFWDVFDEGEGRADVMAKNIYVDWLIGIRNHYTEKKEENLTLV